MEQTNNSFLSALLGFFACWFLLVPSQLLSIFSQNQEIIEIGIPCLYVAAFAQPFMATSIVFDQALRGAGDTKTAFYVSLAGWFFVRLSATYLFAFVFDLGLLGVWLGSTCDWMVRCFTLMAIFFPGKWRKVPSETLQIKKSRRQPWAFSAPVSRQLSAPAGG